MRLDTAKMMHHDNTDVLLRVSSIPDNIGYVTDSLRATISRDVDLGDAQGRISAEVIAAMRDAGLFRMLQPSRFGGGEIDPPTFFATQAELARIDMSAGWLHGVMGVLAFHLALFPERAQDEVWRAQPDALLASSYMQTGRASPVEGGYRVEGTWHFASGADYADWFLLGATAPSANGAIDRFVILVPRDDVTITPEWRVTGLKATGSQGVGMAGGFVPNHRVHGIQERFDGRSPGLTVNTVPLYRLPLPQLLFRVISVPAVGALHGLLDALLEHNRDRVGVTGVAANADPVILLTVGEAAALIDELTVVLRASFERMLDDARLGVETPVAQRMIYRLQATSVVDRCCGMAVRLFQAAGTSGLAADKPFGCYLADIQAARQHAANQFEGHGRALGAALLGADAEDTLL